MPKSWGIFCFLPVAVSQYSRTFFTKVERDFACQYACNKLDDCARGEGSYCQSTDYSTPVCSNIRKLPSNDTSLSLCFAPTDPNCSDNLPALPCDDAYTDYSPIVTLATPSPDDLCRSHCEKNVNCREAEVKTFCSHGDIGTFSVCFGLYWVDTNTTCYKPNDPEGICQDYRLDPVTCGSCAVPAETTSDPLRLLSNLPEPQLKQLKHRLNRLRLL